MKKVWQINFRNRDQVTLYECELKGQISDGNWENSSPHNHYKLMCEAKAVVNSDNLGANFTPRRKYNFSDRELLSVVGERMIHFVKTKKAFPKLRYDDHWDWDVSDGVETLRQDAKEGKYWKEKIKKMEILFGMSLEKAYEKIQKVDYSRTDLIRDLKDMKFIVNNLRMEV